MVPCCVCRCRSVFALAVFLLCAVMCSCSLCVVCRVSIALFRFVVRCCLLCVDLLLWLVACCDVSFVVDQMLCVVGARCCMVLRLCNVWSWSCGVLLFGVVCNCWWCELLGVVVCVMFAVEVVSGSWLYGVLQCVVARVVVLLVRRCLLLVLLCGVAVVVSRSTLVCVYRVMFVCCCWCLMVVDCCRCVLVLGVLCSVGCACVVLCCCLLLFVKWRCLVLWFAVVGCRLLLFGVIVVCCILLLVGVGCASLVVIVVRCMVLLCDVCCCVGCSCLLLLMCFDCRCLSRCVPLLHVGCCVMLKCVVCCMCGVWLSLVCVVSWVAVVCCCSSLFLSVCFCFAWCWLFAVGCCGLLVVVVSLR